MESASNTTKIADRWDPGLFCVPDTYNVCVHRHWYPEARARARAIMANCGLQYGQNIVNLLDHAADPEYKNRTNHVFTMRAWFDIVKWERMLNGGAWIEYAS
jgi:hypothetical protein